MTAKFWQAFLTLIIPDPPAASLQVFLVLVFAYLYHLQVR